MRPNSRKLAAVAIALGALVAPAIASAQTIELGATKSPLVAPVCPPNVSSANCTIVLTRVTALETLRDGISYPTKVTRAGRITAFTVGLSKLSTSKSTQKTYVHYLDQTYGGTAQVGVTVLKPVGKHSAFRWEVVAASNLFHVIPYLGTVVQLPLETSIEVKPGYVVALSTPTWAPVLTIDQVTKKFAYRQSRNANCNNPPSSSQAQITPKSQATYSCNYPGTRVEYSATEVTYPNGTNPVQ
ncbi:MAG TPA: hypothetical protein VGH24_02975 [Solirubrobacteraceae bacterium]